MLLPELKSEIEKRWAGCWPTSNLKPLVIVDLIAYLFFIRQLDIWQKLLEDRATVSGQPPKHPLYTHEQQELRWSSFRNLSPDELHHLFTKENGVLDFIAQYGKSPHVYSRYLQAPLLLTPTPRLLEHTVAMVKAMETAEEPARMVAFDFILGKLGTTGEGGQVPVPLPVVRMMVALANPGPDDVVYDPLAGTGRFLAASAVHVREYYKHAVTAEDAIPHISGSFIGTEPDPILRRIAAVNMILHGIEDPQVMDVDSFNKDNTAITEEATIIFANPPFSGELHMHLRVEDLLNAVDSSSPPLYYLAWLLRTVQMGGRAAVLLPEHVLQDSTEAPVHVRQALVNKHRLEAVIALPAGLLRPYTGVRTAILVFSKTEAGGTEKVWFYDLQAVKTDPDEEEKPAQATNTGAGTTVSEGYGTLPHLYAQWQALRNAETGTSVPASGAAADALLVPADDIRQHGYSLKISSYRKPEQSRLNGAENVTMQEKTEAAPAKKRNNTPVFLMLLLLGLGALAFFLFFNTSKTAHVFANSQSVPPADTVQTTDNAVEENEEDSTGFPSAFPAATPNEPEVQTTARSLSKTNAQQTAAPAAGTETNAAPKKKGNPTEKGATRAQYKVISKAYFYNEPDERARRNAFITHWNNSYATIIPLDERNGFIYTVFTNHLGQTSRGWLRKKDLKAITPMVDGDDAK